MARFTTPLTDVSFNTHLNPVFELGASNQSLNLAGQRIFPRVDAGGTGVSELRNKSFLYALASIVAGEEEELTNSMIVDEIEQLYDPLAELGDLPWQ